MAITTGVQNGADVVVYINGTAVVCGTVSSFDTSHDVRDTSCKDSQHRTVREGRLSWSGSADVLFQQDASYGFHDLFTLQQNRTKFQVKFSSETVGDTYWYGDCYIGGLSLEHPDQDNMAFSIDFEGTGALTAVAMT